MLLNEDVKFNKSLEIGNLTPIIEEILKLSKNENVIFILDANLGVGKTTLVKEIVSFLGVSDVVSSPTFAKLNIYNNHIFHYDLYNIDLNKFFSLGLYEELEKDGLHFIEWGTILEEKLVEYGFKVHKIKIFEENSTRRYELVTLFEGTEST